MTTDEKLQHFLDICMEDARDRGARVFDEYASALDKSLEEHKAEARHRVRMQIQGESEKIEREINKELALELLEYVMSPEVQLASIEQNGVPCRFSCLTDPTVLETYPHLETVCGALETGVYRPVIEEWTEFTNILGTEMDNVIQGTKTLDEALSYAQEQLEQLMAG